MKNKIQIKNIDGKVIFEFEKENNSIKDTIEEAVKNGVSLANAYLSHAYLYSADLKGAILQGANLEGANLEGAILQGANLYKSDLRGANLRDTNFKYACLSNTNFEDANLIDANLYCADLSGAILQGANLRGANIKGANLHNAILKGTKMPDSPMACPERGSFIGWKKVKNINCYYLVKLEIPEDAKRSSATTNKCRCSKAKVLEITNIETNNKVKEVTNYKYTSCTYRVGEMVYPDSFDENRWHECSNGIHFFMDKQDALDYWI